MQKLILLLILFCSMNLNIAYATIYRSVDNKGTVEFSDAATVKSQKVTLPYNAIVSSKASLWQQAKAIKANTIKKTVQFAKLKILQPQDKATFHNNPGNITVTINSQQVLFKQKGVVKLYLDGKFYEQIKQGNAISLDNLQRGSHYLQVKSFTKEGRFVSSSNKITIYLHKASKLFKRPA